MLILPVLLSLLLTAHEEGSDNRYLAYFLYDLMTTDDINSSGEIVRSVDNNEQTELINSFTWKMHELFNRSIVDTVTYTKKMNKLDTSKINLEQQICLMKVDDTIKEKAFMKLKEV